MLMVNNEHGSYGTRLFNVHAICIIEEYVSCMIIMNAFVGDLDVSAVDKNTNTM